MISDGVAAPYSAEQPGLKPALNAKTNEVRARVKLVHGTISAMDEAEFLSEVAEYPEHYSHSFMPARVAIVQAIAEREGAAEIVGPVGPKLAASELNVTIWSSAAKLWDDGASCPALMSVTNRALVPSMG